MSKISTFRPKYEIGRPEFDAMRHGEIVFLHDGVRFITKKPRFGLTETQKVAMDWVQFDAGISSPITCIEHKSPMEPDTKGFCDSNDAHVWYHPYAMAVVAIYCLDDSLSQKIKVYFCNREVHEDNAFGKTHSSSKGVYIVPLGQLIGQPE